jgi:ankyrin repeat protein
MSITMLRHAIYNNDVDEVTALVAEGVDVNASDPYTNVPLGFLRYDNVEIVGILVKAGANIHYHNMLGETVLHLCSRHSFIQCCKYLLMCGANVDELDNANQTPLHYAAFHGSQEAAALLVNYGASLDVVNAGGDTAIHLAVMTNNYKIIELLVAAGASMHIKNNKSETAQERACFLGREKCERVLRDPSALKENTIVQASKFVVMQSLDSAADVCMYPIILVRTLLGVSDRTSLSECRLVCKTWRMHADGSLHARDLEFFSQF